MFEGGTPNALDSMGDPPALLKELVQHSPVAFQVYRADGRCLLANQAFCAMFGWEPGPEYNLFEDEALRARGLLDPVRRAFVGETVHLPPHWHDPHDHGHAEPTVRRRVGIAVTIFPLRGEGGSVGHVALCFQDVTIQLEHQRATEALKRSGDQLAATLTSRGDAAEAAVRESEARKTAVMEAALDAIVIMDHRGAITEFNPAAEKTFGYSSAEAVGKPLVDLLVPPSLRRNHEEGLRRYLDTGEGPIIGKRVEVPALRKDGSEFPAEVAVVRIRSPGPPMFTGYIRDITERRRAAEGEILRREKEAAEAANGLLNAVIEGTSDAIYVKDREGRFLLMNSAGAALVGARPIDMLGRVSAEFLPVHQVERADEHGQLVLTDGVPRTFETTVTLAGEDRTFLVTNGARRDGQGAITGLVGIAREITDRKRAENELRRSKEAVEMANRELEAFSYSVAHDLRAPLRAINGFSTVLLEDYEGHFAGEAQEFLRSIAGAALRMSQLIDALLALAHLTLADVRRERVDLTRLAHSVGAQLRAKEPGRQIDFIVREDLVAEGDAPLLRAILENLLGNAWKFTSKQSHARIEFGRHEIEGELAYFVRDNGAGFDVAHVAKLFAPFRRLHSASEFEGTGVGLATVQRIVRRHGGRVWAESAENAGATFHFTLAEGVGSDGESWERER